MAAKKKKSTKKKSAKKKANKLRFKYEFAVEGPCYNQDEEVSFKVGRRPRYSVRIHRSAGQEHARCVVQCERLVESRTVLVDLESLPESGPSWLAEAPGVMSTIEMMARWKALHEDTQEFLQSVWNDLAKIAVNTLHVVRWRLNQDGKPLLTLRPKKAVFTLGGRTWKEQPVRRRLSGNVMTGKPVEPVREEIQEILDDGIVEPVYHSLLREARHLKDRERFRPALTLAISAAEVATKTYFSECAGNAREWIWKTPSPPLTSILKLLPSLAHAEGATSEAVQIPSSVRKALATGIEKRNRLVHQGEAVNEVDLADLLIAVSDLVSVIDLYRGYEWAAHHVSEPTKQAMNL